MYRNAGKITEEMRKTEKLLKTHDILHQERWQSNTMENQRENTESIKSLLADIRNDGIKKPRYIRKLLAKLTEENGWSDEQCRCFYEALLYKYIKDEKYLNLMLAISGIDEEFGGCLKTASKRRESYFEHLKVNDPTEKREDADSLRRNEEEHCLNYIAEKLEEAMENGESPKLVKLLIFGEEKMKRTEENTEGTDVSNNDQHHSTSSQITNSITNNFFGNSGDAFANQGDGNQIIKKDNKKSKFFSNIKNNTIKIPIFIIAVIGCVLGYRITHSSFPPVTDIALPPEEVILKPGDYHELKPYILPEESTNASLSYTSEYPEVATVSRKGMVLAQGKWEGEGSRTTEITIQAESGATAKQLVIVEKGSDDILPTADVEDFEPSYTIQASVRLAGTTGKNWTNDLDVKVGDEVEYQIEYTNKSNDVQNHVVIRDVLPSNLEYIPGSTKVWNGNHPNGVTLTTDAIVDGGVDIGSYNAGANAIVRFRAKVVDTDLACGGNMLVNWGRGSIGNTVLQDYANVHLTKE